jgi:uncharacterized protein (DUF1697 family)
MARQVALLRGINVGKTKRIAMEDLREMLVGLRYGDVKTLLASGNVVFTAPGDAEAIEARIRHAIAKRFGFDVSVMVRSARELAKVVASNPLKDGESDGAKLHVAFLSAKPAAAKLRDVDPADFAPEEFAVAGREIYMWCKNGVLESKLFSAFSDKRLGVAATARNWNTVTKLLALTEA